MLGCSHLCPSSIWGYTTRRLPLDVSMKSYAAWLAHWPQRDHYTIQQSTYITIWVTIGNPNVSVWLSPVPGVTADSETDSVHIRPHKRKHKQSGIDPSESAARRQRHTGNTCTVMRTITASGPSTTKAHHMLSFRRNTCVIWSFSQLVKPQSGFVSVWTFAVQISATGKLSFTFIIYCLSLLLMIITYSRVHL